MAKKLLCGYTREEIDEMSKLAGIAPVKFMQALLYMEEKRKLISGQKKEGQQP